MKKVTIVAMAVMVLASGAMAANVNDYVKNGIFDTKGYFKAQSHNKNKDKVSEPELLLRLVMMKEALKNAVASDEASNMETSVTRNTCGGTAQRLNSEYGSYENMNISQQEIKAGVVNMRQSWGHLCWKSASQYRYDGWREYNFEKAMWGQAYSMAVVEKLATNKIKERILEGENLDPNYVKKQPLYNSLKILHPLVNNQSNLKERIISGYAVNDIGSVEGNLFENIVSSAMVNGEPWRISQFLNRPRDFIADMKKNPMVTKYYDYMASQMRDPDLLLKNIKEKLDADEKVKAKIDEEKRITKAKIDEEKRISDEKARLEAEAVYAANLPKLKETMLSLRKDAAVLVGTEASQLRGNLNIKEDLYKCKRDKYNSCYRQIDIKGIPYVFAFRLENALFGGYKVNLSSKHALVSQCRTVEENNEQHIYLFGQYANLPLDEKNQMIQKRIRTKQFKIDEATWESMHPVWGQDILSSSDIEYAVKQIEIEANKE